MQSVAAFLCVLACSVDAIRTKRTGSLETCGVKGVSGRNASISIVNGQAADECEWRWQVGFRKRSWNKRLFCGGALITPEWVLTAAHCARKADFDVVAGDYNTGSRSKTEQWKRAAEWIRHPRYNANTYNYDYAMVKLDSPVEISECAGTVCLPSDQDVAAGTKCWITGWGSSKVGGSLAKVLQEAEVGIIGNSDCQNNFQYEDGKITENMLCAQGKLSTGETVDACTGDSGGPLVCESGGQWTLFGTTSWGKGCAAAEYPGVWSDTYLALDFIQEVLAGGVPTLPPGSCPPYCTTCTSQECEGCCD